MSARLPRWFRAKTLLLQPNVFAPAQGSNLGFRGGFNVAGNSEIANQYLLDGVDNNDEATNQPLHRPILDSVREFRVLTGTYSAEFGANLGGTATVLRAGFGTFYNHQIVGNGITPLFRNSPFRQRQTSGPFQATDRPNPADAFVGSPSVVAPGIQQNFRSAYVNQWSLSIQRELASNLVIDLSYIGSEGHKLPVGWNINQAFPGAGSVNSRRLFPAFANITGGFISSIGNSNFHGFSARVECRFTQGLSFLSTFMWSKSIDDNFGVSSAADGSGFFAQDARDLRAERGLSDFDIKLRWVFSTVY